MYSNIEVFEASRWYLTAQINFAYQKECKFIQTKCIIDKKSISQELCVSNDNLCDVSHLSYGNCNLNNSVGDISLKFSI